MSKKKMNFLQRLVHLFIAPIEVMHEIGENPRLFFPFLYVFVVQAVTGVLQQPMVALQQENLGRLSMERYGTDLFSAASNGISTGQTVWINILFTPIALWIGWLIGSFFLWLISKVIKGKSTYKQILSLSIHVSMVTATIILLLTPIDLLLQNSSTIFGLSVLYPNGNATSFIYNLLSVMTLSTIWGTILTGIGLSIMNKFSKWKGYVTAIILYLITSFLGASVISMSFWLLDLTSQTGL